MFPSSAVLTGHGVHVARIQNGALAACKNPANVQAVKS
jgi:hypothetical protein